MGCIIILALDSHMHSNGCHKFNELISDSTFSWIRFRFFHSYRLSILFTENIAFTCPWMAFQWRSAYRFIIVHRLWRMVYRGRYSIVKHLEAVGIAWLMQIFKHKKGVHRLWIEKRNRKVSDKTQFRNNLCFENWRNFVFSTSSGDLD